MNETELDLIKKLEKQAFHDGDGQKRLMPGSDFEVAKASFLKQFPIEIKSHPEYIIDSLESAYEKKDGVAIEHILFVAGVFGLYSVNFVDILIKIISAPWHYLHEDIARIFEKLKNERAIEALYKTATSYFKYLDFEGGHRMLAVQCIWSLGAIGTPEASEKIKQIGQMSNDPVVKERAEMQLRGDRGPML